MGRTIGAIGFAVLAYFVVAEVIAVLDPQATYAGATGVVVGICVFLYFRPVKPKEARLNATRLAAPQMRGDEEVAYFDSGLRLPKKMRTEFLATQRALYLVYPRTDFCTRTPYQCLDAATWNRDSSREPIRFTMVHVGGSEVSFALEQGSGEALVRYVAERVESLRTSPVFEYHLALTPAGHGATLSWRRVSDDPEEADAFIWTIEIDKEIDPCEIEAFRREHAAAIRAKVQELQPQALSAQHREGERA